MEEDEYPKLHDPDAKDRYWEQFETGSGKAFTVIGATKADTLVTNLATHGVKAVKDFSDLTHLPLEEQDMCEVVVFTKDLVNAGLVSDTMAEELTRLDYDDRSL